MVAFASKFTSTQSPEDMKLISQAARCAAYIHLTFGVPLVRITPAEYRQGKRGFLGHMDVAISLKAGKWQLGRKSDPGKSFPWDLFLNNAKIFVQQSQPQRGDHVRIVQPKGAEVEASNIVNYPPKGSTPTIDVGDTAAKKPAGRLPELMPGEISYLKSFCDACQKNAVEPGSLAWVVRFIRALRKELGDENIGAAQLAKMVAKAIKK